MSSSIRCSDSEDRPVDRHLAPATLAWSFRSHSLWHQGCPVWGCALLPTPTAASSLPACSRHLLPQRQTVPDNRPARQAPRLGCASQTQVQIQTLLDVTQEPRSNGSQSLLRPVPFSYTQQEGGYQPPLMAGGHVAFPGLKFCQGSRSIVRKSIQYFLDIYILHFWEPNPTCQWIQF